MTFLIFNKLLSESDISVPTKLTQLTGTKLYNNNCCLLAMRP